MARPIKWVTIYYPRYWLWHKTIRAYHQGRAFDAAVLGRSDCGREVVLSVGGRICHIWINRHGWGGHGWLPR